MSDIVSICITIYCLILLTVQCFLKHEGSKYLISLRYLSQFIIALASASIAFSSYTPHLWSNQCYCHLFWSSALISYILALFLLKAIYVARVCIISKDSIFGTLQTKLIVCIAALCMVVTFAASVTLIGWTTTGQCDNSNNTPQKFECIATFHIANIYLAFGGIIIDTMLFSALCYKWYKIMKIFNTDNPKYKIPKRVIQTLIIQYFLTIIAMFSYFLDNVVHLLSNNNINDTHYNITNIVFLIDCLIVSTCSFCMNSESQSMIRRILCFLHNEPNHESSKKEDSYNIYSYKDPSKQDISKQPSIQSRTVISGAIPSVQPPQFNVGTNNLSIRSTGLPVVTPFVADDDGTTNPAPYCQIAGVPRLDSTKTITFRGDFDAILKDLQEIQNEAEKDINSRQSTWRNGSVALDSLQIGAIIQAIHMMNKKGDDIDHIEEDLEKK